MRDLLTGRTRGLVQSLDGLLHDAQPPAAVAVAAEQLGSAGRPLVEPGSLFVDGNYSLQLSSWNSLAGVTLEVRARFLGSDGQIVDIDSQHIPNTNRTRATTLIPLPIGFPLNVMVFASAGTPIIGQTFVQVQIVRGFTGALLPVATILQGYVTSVQAVAWPGTPIQSSIDGGGVVRQIVGTDPAAGAEISETVPAGARWELVSFHAVLTCSGVAGNRRPRLLHTFGGSNSHTILPTPSILTASGQRNLVWTQGVPWLTDTGTDMCAPLAASTSLLAGTVIATSTLGMDAGDDYTAPVYVVKEWLEAAA